MLPAKLAGHALYFNRPFAHEIYYYGIYFYEIYFYSSVLLRGEYTTKQILLETL
jgi:hypothetical protein